MPLALHSSWKQINIIAFLFTTKWQIRDKKTTTKDDDHTGLYSSNDTLHYDPSYNGYNVTILSFIAHKKSQVSSLSFIKIGE